MSSATTNNKHQLAWILAIPVIVVAFSSLFFYMARNNVISLGTVNRGVLIQPPAELPALKPQRRDGSEFLFNRAESKWVYMVVGGRDCFDDCERMLYLTRQTRLALGKKTPRVERVYLSLDGGVSPGLQAFLEKEHDDITVLTASAQGFTNSLPALAVSPLAPKLFYVVDPLGWVMMYYQADNTELATLTSLGKDILKDMKRLLR